LFRDKKLDFPQYELERVVWIISSYSDVHFWEFPYQTFIKRIQSLHESNNFSEDFINKLATIKIPKPEWMPLKKVEETYNAYIDKMISDESGHGMHILDKDSLGEGVHKYLDQLPDADFENWEFLCKEFAQINSGTKLKKTSIKFADILIKEIGKDKVVEAFTNWVNLGTKIYKDALRNQVSSAISTLNRAFLRNIVLMGSHLNERPLTDAIGDLGLVCLKKLRNYGQIDKKVGNACIMTFSLLPFDVGIEKLTKYRSKIKYASTLKIIENRIAEVSRKEGKTSDEIEEMGVSSMGLNETHEARVQMDDYLALVKIESVNSVNLFIQKPDGKIQKTAPAALKKKFGEEIKALKKSAKEIKELLQANKFRIEKFYLKQRAWKYENWFKYYISHPLIGYLGKKIIWNFSKNKNNVNAIWQDGKWFNPHGENIDWIDETTTVKLWHPIADTADYISTWRDWLIAQEIQQPFKQAFREIYIVTEAELNTESYSNRFAAHIIRQFQFNALCQQRGWKYSLQGNWDSHNTPFVKIPNWNIKAEFWVEADHNGETATSGIFNYVFTDQIRFYENRQLLTMTDVPSLVFSEVMRDVDLFVGVTSIGNDPDWQDNGNNRFTNYWQGYTQQDLTQTAKTRKAVLEKLIPRLKIAKQCSFTDKHLVVEGKIRTYKIHLGSGNILMEPNDQYLCIVPDQKAKMSSGLFLPFEGDRMLSIVLSKAMLLAADEKIKDKTITRQLKR